MVRVCVIAILVVLSTGNGFARVKAHGTADTRKQSSFSLVKLKPLHKMPGQVFYCPTCKMLAKSRDQRCCYALPAFINTNRISHLQIQDFTEAVSGPYHRLAAFLLYPVHYFW